MSVPPPRPGGGGGSGGLWPTIIGGILGMGMSIMSNQSARDEAAKNRQFQKDMSDTAHQRQVRDLMLAGLNPMLSAHSGASAPSGSQANLRDPSEGASRGIASALAIKQLAAQVSLTEAQAENVRAQTGDLHSQAAAGRYVEIANRVHAQDLSLQQAKELLPIVIAQAKAELRLTTNSAQAAKAAAILDELAATGAFNEAEFQKVIGQGGKWLKLLGELGRTIKGR